MGLLFELYDPIDRLTGRQKGVINKDQMDNFLRSMLNGALVYIDEMCAAGFHAISRGVCIGHAFGGIPVRWDLPVDVFGCAVRPGQLIHVLRESA